MSDTAPCGGQWRGHPGGEPGPQDAFCAGGTCKIRNAQVVGSPHGANRAAAEGRVLLHLIFSQPNVISAAQGLSSFPKGLETFTIKGFTSAHTMNIFIYLFFCCSFSDILQILLMLP